MSLKPVLNSSSRNIIQQDSKGECLSIRDYKNRMYLFKNIDPKTMGMVNRKGTKQPPSSPLVSPK